MPSLVLLIYLYKSCGTIQMLGAFNSMFQVVLLLLLMINLVVTPTISLILKDIFGEIQNTKLLGNYIRQLSMHRPLSLFPNSKQQRSQSQLSYNSGIFKNTDSLIFSVSSHKNQSGKSSFLTEDRHLKLSKQLQCLQTKIGNLQTQIMPIKLKNKSQNVNEKTIKYHCNKFDNHSTAQFFNRLKMCKDKENSASVANRAGKIVKKKKNQSEKSIRVLTSNTCQSNVGNQSMQSMQKTKDMTKLKRQLEIMKNSLEKSQRSVSLCSEKLSESKSIIKKMKNQEAKQKKNFEQLRNQLKKSETIRQKQKNIIVNQKKQLQKYRQLLKKSHKYFL